MKSFFFSFVIAITTCSFAVAQQESSTLKMNITVGVKCQNYDAQNNPVPKGCLPDWFSPEPEKNSMPVELDPDKPFPGSSWRWGGYLEGRWVDFSIDVDKRVFNSKTTYGMLFFIGDFDSKLTSQPYFYFNELPKAQKLYLPGPHVQTANGDLEYMMIVEIL